MRKARAPTPMATAMWQFRLGKAGAMFGRSPPAVALAPCSAGGARRATMLARAKTACGWPRSWRAASGCRRGGSPCRRRLTPTALPSRWARAADGTHAGADLQWPLPRHGGRCVCRTWWTASPARATSLLGQVVDITRSHAQRGVRRPGRRWKRRWPSGDVACCWRAGHDQHRHGAARVPASGKLRRVAVRRYGTLLLIDERTPSRPGLGGYTRPRPATRLAGARASRWPVACPALCMASPRGRQPAPRPPKRNAPPGRSGIGTHADRELADHGRHAREPG